MKKVIYIFLSLTLFFSCRKEKGKEPYDLIFTFSSGDILSIECYVSETSDTHYYENKKKVKLIHVRKSSYPAIGYNLGLEMFKTEYNTLLCIDAAYLKLENTSFAGNQTVFLNGVIEMEGPYTRKGIKFIVDDGTFTFNWNNAPDYGEPVQVLSGTWTLKRK